MTEAWDSGQWRVVSNAPEVKKFLDGLVRVPDSGGMWCGRMSEGVYGVDRESALRALEIQQRLDEGLPV